MTSTTENNGHTESCNPCGALHAYSFDRQTRNQRTFVLCGKHFAFHIWLGFFFERKTREQRENTVSVRRTHTHTHIFAGNLCRLSEYLFVAFPARGTLEMSTERGRGKREGERNGCQMAMESLLMETDRPKNGENKRHLLLAPQSMPHFLPRHTSLRIFPFCNLSTLFTFINHLGAWYFL